MKDLNGKAITGSFHEKEFLWSKLAVSYYPEPPDIHIRDEVKELLDLLVYATKKN